MIWLIYAFLTALSNSLIDVFGKRSLNKINEYTVAFSLRLFAVFFLLPIFFFVEIPIINNPFWISLIVSGTLNAIAIVLYMKAIKSSDLSITIPFITFTPLFLLLTSPLILSEFPSTIGVFGVLLIVAGAYFMKIKEKKKGFLSPFKHILKEKGPRLMLVVAFIYSISSNFDKIGVVNSSPLFWAISMNLFNVLILFPVVYFKSSSGFKEFEKHWKSVVPIGLFMAAMIFFQMNAIEIGQVTYVISIKRTSAIMSVIFGVLIFKDKGIKERLLGAVLMVLGVVLITLG